MGTCYQLRISKKQYPPAQPFPVAARPDGRDPVFVFVMDYLLEGNQLVEPLYVMDKAGKLGRAQGQAVAPEARAFIEGRLLSGGDLMAGEVAVIKCPYEFRIRRRLA